MTDETPDDIRSLQDYALVGGGIYAADEPGFRRLVKLARRGKVGTDGRADFLRALLSVAQDATRKEGARLLSRCAADVPPESVTWLWPTADGRSGYCARGKLTVIAGDPGHLKSWMALDLAARVSAGAELPGGGGKPRPGSVLILSAEDGAADTIIPRLKAAGADLRRVHILDAVREKNGAERSFNLTEHLDLLEKQAEVVGEVVLVIVDPISAYHGGIDSHKNADMRAMLAPLSTLAERGGFALLCITHLNKGQGSPLARVTGSVALPAVARLAFLVVPDPDDPERRILAPLKANICRQGDLGLSYRVEGDPPRIVWGERDPRPLADLLREAGAPGDRAAQEDPEARALDWVRRDPNCSAADVARNVRCFKGPGGAERAAATLDARAERDAKGSGQAETLVRRHDGRSARYRVSVSPVSVSGSGLGGPVSGGGGDRDAETPEEDPERPPIVPIKRRAAWQAGMGDPEGAAAASSLGDCAVAAWGLEP